MQRLLPIVLLAILIQASGGVESLLAQSKKDQQPGAIRVQVEMVSLPAVVMTKEGRYVTDLEKEDFTVFENGVEQQIVGFAPTEQPISVALLLDTSGSTEQRLARFQNESIRFVNLLHPGDSVAVLSFSKTVSLHEDFSFDRDRNARGIKETRPGGSTVLYEAVWLSLEEVLKPVEERKALVVFTDGVDTASHLVSRKETLELAKETRAAIYAIYFDTSRDPYQRSTIPTAGGIPMPGPTVVLGPPVYGPRRGGASRHEHARGKAYLRELAANAGGKVFDAMKMQDLGSAFASVARELSSQYSIGYYSSNQKRDGKFRKVKIKMKEKGLVARTKKGYYAPKDGK